MGERSWFSLSYNHILMTLPKITGCDYALQDFVKLSGRRPEEGPAPFVSMRERDRVE